MHIRIGKFNELPLYINIPTPLQWFKQSQVEKDTIAFIQPKIKYYDQLKAKFEAPISIISEKDLSNNHQFSSWVILFERIIVQARFLLLPKLDKLFIFWHEYGHYIAPLYDDEGDRSSFYEVIEAIASFYACCKLKLHFNEYIKIRRFSPLHRLFSLKRPYNKAHLIHEKRYNKFYISKQLPLGEREEEDHIYEFYRRKDSLIEWYEFCFKDVCDMDYQHFFSWNDFLTEIGWENDEERWKYIDYKNKSDCT